MVDMDTMPRAMPPQANYDVWTADTEITLTNVPWDNNYRDVVKFSSEAERNRYIDSLESVSTRIEKATYARADRPINLTTPLTDAYEFNYIRVRNRAQNPTRNRQMYFYYFILGVEMVNAGVTRFHIQLDVWQSFGDRVKWGDCYIERGHIGIANELGFVDYGRRYLTLPEGLDTGSEHRTVENFNIPVMSPNDCNFMIVCNTSLTTDPGDQDNPNFDMATGQTLLGTPSGSNVYIFRNRASLVEFLKDYSPFPHVLQGIMQISAIPDLFKIGYRMKGAVFAKSKANAYTIDDADYGRGTYTKLFDDWRNNAQVISQIPERYRHLKKFWTFPYMSIELTFMSGTPIVIKPEQWQNPNGSIAIKTNVVAPGQRIVAYPREYNGNPNAIHTGAKQSDGTQEYYLDGGDNLEHSTSVGSLPQFAIVNNGGILALANQAHSIAQQTRSMDWSQSKALQGNQVSYDQSTAGINNAMNQGDISRGAATASADIANDQAIARGAISAGQGGIGGATAGLAGGGAGSAIGAATGIASGIAGTALDVQARNRNLAVSNGASRAAQDSNTNTSAFVRDTNKNLSDWSARGDYAQSIAAQQAKIQDTAMTPPFTSGQAGGELFNFVHGGINLVAKFKMLPPAELRAIGEYWLRYGYAVGLFARLPASLMVMTDFTYWKLSETYIIEARMPEAYKQAIRGIMEKGVTVWKDPRKIGQTNRANNKPLTGISI